MQGHPCGVYITEYLKDKKGYTHYIETSNLSVGACFEEADRVQPLL